MDLEVYAPRLLIIVRFFCVPFVTEEEMNKQELKRWVFCWAFKNFIVTFYNMNLITEIPFLIRSG